MGKQQVEMAAKEKGIPHIKDCCKLFFLHVGRWYMLTPWAPIGGNEPAFGIGPTRGLFVGEQDLLAVGLQEWSVKSVFMSGFGRGFLQSWCYQFKLKHSNREMSAKRFTFTKGESKIRKLVQIILCHWKANKTKNL